MPSRNLWRDMITMNFIFICSPPDGPLTGGEVCRSDYHCTCSPPQRRRGVQRAEALWRPLRRRPPRRGAGVQRAEPFGAVCGRQFKKAGWGKPAFLLPFYRGEADGAAATVYRHDTPELPFVNGLKTMRPQTFPQSRERRFRRARSMN